MVTLQAKFQLGCLILAGVGAFLASKTVKAAFVQNNPFTVVLYGFGSLLFSLISLLFWDIQNHKPANSHNFRSLTFQYLLILINTYLHKWALRRYYRFSRNVRDIQEKTLLTALAANKNTVYGMKYNFGGIKDMTQYVSRVPLITYKDIEPFVDQIANGEEGILTSSKVFAFARSSGTTGKPKLIPFARHSRLLFLESWALGMGSFFKRCEFGLGRVVGLRYKGSIYTTQGGLRAGAITQLVTPYHAHFVSPLTIYDIVDQTTSYYLHAVFALQDKEVVMVDALQAPIALAFFRTLETYWKNVCNDIAKGKLSESLKLSLEQRLSLNSLLTPNVERAEELEQEFERGFTGIGTRVWPRLTCVWIINTGSAAVQAKILADVYLKGVYQVNTAHASSEGLIGINTATVKEAARQVVYSFWLNGMHYEFIPIEHMEENNPKTLLLHELTLGGVYEVVLTNCTCLYRYRLGDVIKVVGFQNQAPLYEFQYRAGELLSLSGEKTTQKHLKAAIDEVLAALPGDVILVDYTSTDTTVLADITSGSTQPGIDNHSPHDCYVVFLELEKDGKPFLLDKLQINQFDASLQIANNEYQEDRNNGLIGPMIVNQVARGTFHKLQSVLTAESNSMQYKTPRVLRKRELVELLIDQSIQTLNVDDLL